MLTLTEQQVACHRILRDVMGVEPITNMDGNSLTQGLSSLIRLRGMTDEY